MLDPHFKSLWVVENFLRCKNAIHLAIKYERKRLSLFLWQILIDQTLLSKKCLYIVPIDGLDRTTIKIGKEDTNIFGVGISMEESSCAIVTRRLFLFWRLYIPLSKCVDPLAWWWTHESQFPNVDFLAKQFFKDSWVSN